MSPFKLKMTKLERMNDSLLEHIRAEAKTTGSNEECDCSLNRELDSELGFQITVISLFLSEG